jgi:hypothetical protein
MQTGSTTPTLIRETTESVWQLGAYVFLTLAAFFFITFLVYRKGIPRWEKMLDQRAEKDAEREAWARAQVERAQTRLDMTYDKIPVVLADIAARMEEGNRLNREAFQRLFDQHAKILDRLPLPDPRELGNAGRIGR